MAPPAKRRKRNIVESSASGSDSEYEETPADKSKARLNDLISSSPLQKTSTASGSSKGSAPKTTTTKVQTRAKTANHPHNAAPIYLPTGRSSIAGTKSASSSPEKRKSKSKVDTSEKGKSGDIFTFFTKQAQKQQAAEIGGKTTAKRPAVLSPTTDGYADVISDGDNDDVGEPRAEGNSFIGRAVRKRANGIGTLKNGDGDAPGSSQKFLRKSSTEERKREEDLRPWAERFAPINLDELAVHKKKVADVKAWLEAVMEGRMRQRLLLLKGAAGTGKTTTIQLLAKALDCDILEWRNPVGSIAVADGFQSMTAQFEEFMGRGGRFGQLDVFSSDREVSTKVEAEPADDRKRLILVEEFPNTFTRSSTALQSFRSTIIQYLAANTPPLSVMYNNNQKKGSITPVVMIVSETLLTTTSASADSFTAHRLLGPEILQHPGVFCIEFNAIAPTLLAKALEVIVQKESRKSGRRKTPGPLVLRRLGEIGDIRSAIGSLEFLCLRGDADGDWGSKITFAKTKRPSKEGVPLTKMEEESLELITRREASLGIFHAVGKVVYNKREEAVPPRPKDQDVEALRDFMSMHARPRRSQVAVDELIDETGTDTQTFVAALHENYILSCDPPPNSYEFSSLDHVNGCIDALSDSDLLCPSWDGSFNSTGFGGGTGGRGSGGDILRQDEFSFQIAVRGILFSLPDPVKRRDPASAGLRTGRSGDAFKMFYPTSLKLWRMKEEMESTIDLWVTRLMKGDTNFGTITSGAAAFAKPSTGTVETWKHRNNSASNTSNKEPEASTLLSVGTSARKEMLIERLPYMVQIARASKKSTSAFAIRDMEKVTTFNGIGGPSDDAPDEGDDAAPGEEWATDKPVEGTSPKKKKGLVIRGRGMANTLPLLPREQKLVLSDDDIEDD